MEEAVKAPPTLDGLGAAGRSFLPRFDRSGEDRLVFLFVVVSAIVHAFVLLFGGLHWLREKPPLADEWTMDADLVTDLDLPPPTRQALPKAELAPEAKAAAELLPQITKKFAVKEPTKADEPAPAETPQPKEAKPAEVTKKVEEPVLKTDDKDDNKLDQKEIMKRLALERLRNQEKTAKATEAPEKDQLAQLADILDKNQKSNAGFASSSAKGRINKYYGQLKRAIQRNYTLPSAYNLKGANLRVVLAITLSEGGDLQDLQVKQSSNDPAFDELTVQAVKASAPLPKPPKELIGEEIPLGFTPQETN